MTRFGMQRPRAGRAAAVAVAAALLVAGCSSGSSRGADARVLHAYLDAVEPLREGVNKLLDDADPILDGYRDHELSGADASARMAGLERSFARYRDEVAAVPTGSAALARIHAPYAATYGQEDAYLQALVAGLAAGSFTALPDTQDEQRAALVTWRTDLEALAARAGVTLPADVDHAGRGEIAPAPGGDS